MSPKHKKLLKPLIVVLSLLAVIAISMLGATLSVYVKELSFFTDGWVGAKYFAFETIGNGETRQLAPGESVSYDFIVSNHNDKGIAQVPLHISIEIDYPKQLAGTGVIYAELYYGNALLVSDQGSGSLAVTGETMSAGTPTTDTYTLKLTWIDSDMEYLGEVQSETFEEAPISIRVTAYQ